MGKRAEWGKLDTVVICSQRAKDRRVLDGDCVPCYLLLDFTYHFPRKIHDGLGYWLTLKKVDAANLIEFIKENVSTQNVLTEYGLTGHDLHILALEMQKYMDYIDEYMGNILKLNVFE